MTSAYVLIAAILILGGLIATLGDRLGSKIGKARLRLFNLRPRQTAIIVTVLTGVLIAASTLAILFTLSKSLRQGVFQLDDILKKRRRIQQELIKVSAEKEQVEQELLTAENKQAEIQQNLQELKVNFASSKAQLQEVSQQVQMLEEDVKTLSRERGELLRQRQDLKSQITHLATEIEHRDRQLQQKDQTITEREQVLAQQKASLQQLESKIKQRDLKIFELDKAIEAQDRDIQQRQQNIEALEKERDFLEKEQVFLKREVAVLRQFYQNYQVLRRGNLALVRDQVLAVAAFRLVNPDAAQQVVDRLLREANRNAIQATRTGNGEITERVVQITNAQVQQLINQISDGKNYIVRIISAGNYVQGEKQVRVFADVAVNKEIFQAGEVVARVSLDAAKASEGEIQGKLDLLLAAAQFRARRAGILGEIQVADSKLTTLFSFLTKIQQMEEPPEEIQVLATEITYTAGPLTLHLVAIKDGEIVVSTN